jgi:uncharacterized delta-60 repeat protein
LCCLLFFAFFFINTPCLCASNGWAATYGGADTDRANSIQQTSDGGYIVAGETRSFSAGWTDVWVLKLRPDGTVEWQRAYGGGDWDRAYSIQQTNDGGYIVIGETSSFGAGGTDIWVLKLRPFGTVEWQKTYGGVGYERANAIQQTSDGGYIAIGTTDSFVAGATDIWILKLKPNGAIEWQRTYGGVDWDWGLCIRQTWDGGYIVAGDTSSFGIGEEDLWILKLRPDGTVEWERTYGENGRDAGHYIQQTSDGGYIAAGVTKSFSRGAEKIPDLWVLKLRPDGTVEWQKVYGEGGWDWADSVQQTSDGGYIVVGYTGQAEVSRDTPVVWGTDVWILKLRPDGTVEWQKTYGGEDLDGAHSIQQTTDGGYIVAGERTPFGAKDDDFFVLKLRPDGSIASSCDFIRVSEISGKDSNALTETSSATVKDSRVYPQNSSATNRPTDALSNVLCR